MTAQSPADHAVLSPEAVQRLRDAGPKDLLWLICDSHELLRARAEAAEAELAEYKTGPAYQTVVDALRAAEAERDEARQQATEAENERVEWQNRGAAAEAYRRPGVEADFVAVDEARRALDDLVARCQEAEQRVALRDEQIATIKAHMNGRCEHLTARAEAAEARVAELEQALQRERSAWAGIERKARIARSALEEIA